MDLWDMHDMIHLVGLWELEPAYILVRMNLWHSLE